MEVLYELVSAGHSRPVPVKPLGGELFHSRWVKDKEHYTPDVTELLAKDMAALITAKRFGHAAPQHTGFAMTAFSGRGVPPTDLPESIPGIHIGIDQKAKRVRLFDPLETHPQRKEIEAAFLAVYHKYRVPRPEIVFDRLSEADLATWQAWLDKAVSEGTAERVEAKPEPKPQAEPEIKQEQPAVVHQEQKATSEAADGDAGEFPPLPVGPSAVTQVAPTKPKVRRGK